MSRELKFRAWDVDKGEWVAGGEVMDLEYSGRANCFLFDNDAIDIPKRVIWVQYTGLKDKNGKEIYEGDIFKTENEQVGQVIYDTGGFVTVIESSLRFQYRRIDSLGYPVEMGIEVIGNIYEHPELLKEKP